MKNRAGNTVRTATAVVYGRYSSNHTYFDENIIRSDVGNSSLLGKSHGGSATFVDVVNVVIFVVSK